MGAGMGETPFRVFGPAGAAGNTDFITLYLAARILRIAGFSIEEAAKVLEEVYGAKVTVDEVEKWLTMVPPEIRRRQTLLRFALALTREKLPLLSYIAGAIVGDGDLHGGRGRLRVKDENFARAVAEKLSKLIGRDIMIRQQKDGFYCLENVVLGYVKRGLWKILAYIDRYGERRCFLSGLLDAEASISPHLRGKKGGTLPPAN